MPIGVVAAIGAWLRLPNQRGPRARIDIPGVALISSALVLLIWGLVRGGGQAGWTDGLTLGALATGTALFAGFLVWEQHCAEPMIPLQLFRRGAFPAAVATQLCMAAAIFSAAFLTSQYFQLARHASPLGTGLRFLPWTATPLCVAPLAGWLSDKAAGVLNTAQQFGAVLGIAIVTAVFNARGSFAGPATVTSGYRGALAVAAGISVLGAATALGIRTRRGGHPSGSRGPLTDEEATTSALPVMLP